MTARDELLAEPPMVERAARAIDPIAWDPIVLGPPGGMILWSAAQRKGQAKSLEQARAAIATMRVPTEAMLAAAKKPVPELVAKFPTAYSHRGTRRVPTNVKMIARWQAMIDAALDPAGVAERGMK